VSDRDLIARHYAAADLPDRIRAALSKADLDPDRLSTDDIEPIDEMHVRGRPASRELADAAGINWTDRVLDVGCGLGGPARRLAQQTGCRVLGLDLTADYCVAAAMLTRATGLSHQVTYVCADATRLPCGDDAWPVVWSQHAAMNIPDKAALYAEIARVLVPGGRFALYDLMAGPDATPAYPLPWASEPAASHLLPPAHIRGLLEDRGFEILVWREQLPEARAWLEKVRAAASRQTTPPALGMHVLAGDGWAERADNLRAAIESGAVIPVQAVVRKRS